MTHPTDPPRWVPILAGLAILAVGYVLGNLTNGPQRDARAAVTPAEAPTALHTLRGARTACTALHERLEGMQLPSHSPVVVEGE